MPEREQTPGAEPPRKLRLEQFLKLQGITPTGGQAKLRIQAGDVRVNGEVELRRGRGLRPGDRIEIDGTRWLVEAGLWQRKPGSGEPSRGR